MSEVISVRVENKVIAKVDELVKRGLYKDRSDALRDLIMRGLDLIYREIAYRERVEKVAGILLKRATKGVKTREKIDVIKLLDECRRDYMLERKT